MFYKADLRKTHPTVARQLIVMPKTMSYLLLGYGSTERTKIETKLMTSTFDLISSVGGNLGLFLGFSLISTLFIIYELVQKVFNSVYH